MKALAGDRFEVQSAGASASSVHPLAIRVMAEVAIDISRHRSKSLDEFIGQEFDYVITVCANDTKTICPFFPGKAKHRLNWAFEDPAQAEGDEAQRVRIFESVRDQIASRIKEFLSGVL